MTALKCTCGPLIEVPLRQWRNYRDWEHYKSCPMSKESERAMQTMNKLVDGVEYLVHHNGDWSGEAVISWQAEGRRRSVTLPGELLRSCGRQRAIADCIAAIERVDT